MNIISTTPVAERDSCGTPPAILDAARAALGGTITLDPCSNSTAQKAVMADVHWSIKDDCTRQDWQRHAGPDQSLWVNPPYSAPAMRAIVPHIIANAPAFGRGAIVLVNAITDTHYGAALVDACDAVIYPKRINFVGQANRNPHRQMFCVWGCDTAEVLSQGLSSLGMLRSTFLKQDAIRLWSMRMATMGDARRSEVRDWLMTRPTCLEADDFEVFCEMADTNSTD